MCHLCPDLSRYQPRSKVRVLGMTQTSKSALRCFDNCNYSDNLQEASGAQVGPGLATDTFTGICPLNSN